MFDDSNEIDIPFINGKYTYSYASFYSLKRIGITSDSSIDFHYLFYI